MKMLVVVFFWLSNICVLAGSASASDIKANRWLVQKPGVLTVLSDTIRVKDRPAVLKDFKGDNYRLSFRARCLDGGENGQIWFSTHYYDEFYRYAIALRNGLLDDLFILRYRETNFPDTTVNIANCYPIGFNPDTSKWINFRVEVRGGHITVWAGNSKYPQLDYRDPTPIEAGGVALGGSWHTCEFADVKIEKLDSDTQPKGLFSQNAILISCGAADQPVPSGYERSSGEKYAEGKSFGWSRKLSSVRSTKISDKLLRGAIFVNTNEPNASLRVPVKNGDYYVTAGGGDAEAYCQWRLDVENVRLADVRLVPMEFINESVRVTVSDGFCDITLLSISDKPIGIVNPLNYVVIEPWNEVAGRLLDRKRLRAQQRAEYRPRLVDVPAKGRSCISMDGNWLFMPEQEAGIKPESPAVNDKDWHVAKVPSFWNPTGWWIYTGERRTGESYTKMELERVNSQTFNWKTRTAWYRQWIILDDGPEPQRRYMLHFQAVASMADVFCNGEKVGTHTGMFVPFEVDISKQLKKGKNLIAVHVIGEPGSGQAKTDKVLEQAISMIITPEHVGSLPRGIIYSTIRDLQGRPTNDRPSGIWQPVEFVISDEARIVDFFFKPRMDGADIDVEIDNQGSDNWNGSILANIAGVNSKVSVSIAAKNQSKISLKIYPKNFKMWSPGNPNLYELTLSLQTNGRTVDTIVKKVGFRVVETKGDKFYLNGKPYWLGGANSWPHGLTPNDAPLADKAMKILADNNIRINRTHSTPMTKTWIEAADRRGVAISLEGTWPWVLIADTEIPDKALWNFWVEEMKDLVRDLRNNPSIFVWTVANENHIDWDKDNNRRLKKWQMWNELMREIRKIDPTRPIVAYSGYERSDGRHAKISDSTDPRDYFVNFIQKNNIWDGNFTDEHRYIGHYGPSILSYQYNSPSGNVGMGLPVWSQEASTGYPNNDTGHLERKYIKEYVPQAWVGDDAYDHRDPSAYLANVAFMTKEWMEKVRRDRNTAGWQMFCSGNWFRHPYVLNEIEPYPALDAARIALQPVLPSLDLRDRHYIAGQNIVGTLYVVNDSGDARNLKQLHCRIEIVSGTGKVLADESVEVADCPYFGSAKTSVKLKIPEQLPCDYGVYKLKVALSENGRQISDNNYDIVLGTEAWSRGSSKTCKVGATGLNEQQNKVLTALGIQIVSQNPESQKVWIWADKKVPDHNSIDGRKLLDFAEAGGTVVLLETGAAQQLLPEFILPKPESEHLFPEYVEMRNIEHPAFAGLGQHDLKWWNGQGDRPEVCKMVYSIDVANPAISAPTRYIEPHIGQNNWMRKYRAPFFEVKLGNGRVIVCEMCVSVGTTDPIARRFAANLLAWLTEKR
ncbi:MAG: sugar-binding domain-containing protein [Phycisphaerae bacterium]|jgi:hypothetical protein